MESATILTPPSIGLSCVLLSSEPDFPEGPSPVRPLAVSLHQHFAPGPFTPGCFTPGHFAPKEIKNLIICFKTICNALH